MQLRRGFAVVCGVVSALVAGCGSERPGAAAEEASRAAALPTGAVTVYGDALASGWVDWSWSATRNFANTSPVAAGTSSLAATLQAWGGLSLHDGGTPVSGMASLVLSVNGGSASSDLNLYATVGGTAGASVRLAQYCAGGAIPVNAWAKCTVPLSALGVAGQAVDGLGLRDPNGAARATFYLDDVGFVPAAPAAPTGLTAAAGSSAVALSWTAVSGATGYDVYRATSSGGTFSRLTTATQTGTTYSDTAVTAGATYWYQVTATGAGGASARSATASATVPASTGGGTAASFTVYGDALASGFVDWSWSSTRNFANTSPVASGTSSVAVTFAARGGFSLHGLTPVPGMTAVVLSVNGGTASGDLDVFATQGGGNIGTIVTLGQYCTAKTIPAGAWTRCTIPLSALGLAGAAVDGVGVRENTGAARPTMYFDDIGFTSGATTTPTVPATPAGLAATVSGSSVALAWSSVSGATGYDVYRATASGGTFTKLTASPQAATTYTDTACAAGSTCWYQVKAVNAAGASAASGTVSATVPATAPAIAVTVSPASTTLDACKSLKLTATVTGATDTSVVWSVQEGTTGGTIDSSGNYTAPNGAGTFHVVATSKASGAATATAAIVVQQRVLAVAVAPNSASLAAGGKNQFSATVTTTCGTFAAQ